MNAEVCSLSSRQVPARDPLDDPHKIGIGYWLGSVRPDGSPQVELQLSLSSDAGILTPDEARAVAAAMTAAADYADACHVSDAS